MLDKETLVKFLRNVQSDNAELLKKLGGLKAEMIKSEYPPDSLIELDGLVSDIKTASDSANWLMLRVMKNGK